MKGNIVHSYKRNHPYINSGKRVAKYVLKKAAHYLAPKAGNALNKYFKQSLPSKLGGYGKNRFNRVKKLVSNGASIQSNYHTHGTHKGRFQKSRKTSTRTTIYSNRGILSTSEVHGIIADPDCVYITHTACDTYKIIVTSTEALIRKLFEKKGFVITNTAETLGQLSISDAANWKVELTSINGSTGNESIEQSVTTISSDSIQSIAVIFLDRIMKYSSGYNSGVSVGSNDNDVQLHRLNLYSGDTTATATVYRFACGLFLQDETVHMYGCSDLKIQNRTLAANASTNTEDVSNNPLTGKNYLFNGIPKCRDKALFPLNSIPINKGVQLVRANSLPSLNYREPPPTSIFSNCVGSATINLDPGAIKSSKVQYTKTMKYIEFLQKLNIQFSTAGLLTYHSIFPSEIFAFEDLINVNNTQNISCAYESNQILGVYFTTTRKAKGIVKFEQSVYNNIPA